MPPNTERRYSKKPYPWIFIAELSEEPKGGNHPNVEWINHICTVEYYSDTKGNVILQCTATWIYLANITLSERSRHKRPHGIWFISYEILQTDNSIETESRLMAARGWGMEGKGKHRLLQRGGSNQNVSEPDKSFGYTIVHCKMVHFMLCKFYLNKIKSVLNKYTLK